jgi:ribonuclease BN (tRNA processing enzyme)
MQLIVLGSGTTVPSTLRNAAGYYLAVHDREFLIDCGSGVLVQLERIGKSYRTLDAVFITHTHPDHIGDLVRLIHALQYTPGWQREKPLQFFGPKDFAAFFEHHIVALAGRPKHFLVQVTEVDSTFNFSGVPIQAMPTLHSPTVHSVGYRFQQDDKAVVLSGDCDYHQGIIDLADHADLLVLDCSFPDDLKMPGHLCASECGQLARAAKVKRLLLSHFYPVPQGQDKRLEQCRSMFNGPTQMAQDLMAIEI